MFSGDGSVEESEWLRELLARGQCCLNVPSPSGAGRLPVGGSERDAAGAVWHVSEGGIYILSLTVNFSLTNQWTSMWMICSAFMKGWKQTCEVH